MLKRVQRDESGLTLSLVLENPDGQRIAAEALQRKFVSVGRPVVVENVGRIFLNRIRIETPDGSELPEGCKLLGANADRYPGNSSSIELRFSCKNAESRIDLQRWFEQEGNSLRIQYWTDVAKAGQKRLSISLNQLAEAGLLDRINALPKRENGNAVVTRQALRQLIAEVASRLVLDGYGSDQDLAMPQEIERILLQEFVLPVRVTFDEASAQVVFDAYRFTLER